MQDCNIPTANALAILQSWTKPSITNATVCYNRVNLHTTTDPVPVKRSLIISVIWSQGPTWIGPLQTKTQQTMMTSSNEKHFPRYWPLVWGIHRPPVNSPHKGQWRGSLVFSLICDWINSSVNNREAGDLRRHRDHYDVTVMCRAYRPWYIV